MWYGHRIRIPALRISSSLGPLNLNICQERHTVPLWMSSFLFQRLAMIRDVTRSQITERLADISCARTRTVVMLAEK